MSEFVPSRPHLKDLKIGDALLVSFQDVSKMYYAIYSGIDEFDVHMPLVGKSPYRKKWYKHSSSSVLQFTKLP